MNRIPYYFPRSAYSTSRVHTHRLEPVRRTSSTSTSSTCQPSDAEGRLASVTYTSASRQARPEQDRTPERNATNSSGGGGWIRGCCSVGCEWVAGQRWRATHHTPKNHRRAYSRHTCIPPRATHLPAYPCSVRISYSATYPNLCRSGRPLRQLSRRRRLAGAPKRRCARRAARAPALLRRGAWWR